MLKKLPKIIGLCKVRNEAAIIKDTLDNWSGLCTGGIFIYDDVSDDNTVEICWHHRNVKEVIKGSYWDPDREKAEWFNRQQLLLRAQQEAGEDTWFVYFDADEHLYNFEEFGMFNDPDIKAIACRLYDFYITPEDVDKNYKFREWIGPEYRTIVFFFKNHQSLRYDMPDQRIVTLPNTTGIIPIHGDIKHYGKGFSVSHWEETCNYYIRFWPKYADKWRKRRGKAVHDGESDFGNKLIKWNDRNKGFSLEDKIYGQN